MTQNQKIKVGIVGATGYTGVELLRLLASHPMVQVQTVTARADAGLLVVDMFPSLRGFYDTLTFVHPDEATLDKCDVVFFATPNAVAMHATPELLQKGVKIIDLSADFRIRDVQEWEKWYKVEHSCADTVAEAVYGLPEMNRAHIANARLVANPGCYPTCVTLPLIPLLKAQLLVPNEPLIADCKSGVSGAGKKAEVANLMAEASDNFKAYGVTGHRHLPEIRQNLADLGAYNELIFVPHLVPMIRGMHATIYVRAKNAKDDLYQIMHDFYQNSHFVDVLPQGQWPQTRSVRSSNRCRINIARAHGNDERWIILSVIDNLVKGAAGQAIQNFNIMFGFDEETGLNQPPVSP